MIRYLVALLILVPCALFCQTGSIRGQVTDARSGDPLVGARVVIVGSKPGLGAATDLNGMFLIRKVPAETYTIKVEYVDYRTATNHDVVVSPDQATEFNVAMRREGDETTADKESINTVSVAQDSAKLDSSALAK